jgi:hypothetical protein
MRRHAYTASPSPGPRDEYWSKQTSPGGGISTRVASNGAVLRLRGGGWSSRVDEEEERQYTGAYDDDVEAQQQQQQQGREEWHAGTGAGQGEEVSMREDGILGVGPSEDLFDNPVQFHGWRKGWVRVAPVGHEGWEGEEDDLHTMGNASLECTLRRPVKRTGLPLHDRVAALMLALAMAYEQTNGTFEPPWLGPEMSNATLQRKDEEPEDHDDLALVDAATAKLLAKRVLPTAVNLTAGFSLGRNVLLVWNWSSSCPAPSTNISNYSSSAKGSKSSGAAANASNEASASRATSSKAKNQKLGAILIGQAAGTPLLQRESKAPARASNVTELNDYLLVQMRFNGEEMWPSEEVVRSAAGMSMWLENTLPGKHKLSLRSVQVPPPGYTKPRFGQWCTEINITVADAHTRAPPQQVKDAAGEEQLSVVDRWIRKYCPDYMTASELVSLYMDGRIPKWVLERSGLGESAVLWDGTEADVQPEVARARKLCSALKDVKEGYRKIRKWNCTLDAMQETDADLYDRIVEDVNTRVWEMGDEADGCAGDDNLSNATFSTQCVRGEVGCECGLLMVSVPSSKDTAVSEGFTTCMRRVSVREDSDGNLIEMDAGAANSSEQEGAYRGEDANSPANVRGLRNSSAEAVGQQCPLLLLPDIRNATRWPVELQRAVMSNPARPRGTCDFWMRYGSCNLGADCRFLHSGRPKCVMRVCALIASNLVQSALACFKNDWCFVCAFTFVSTCECMYVYMVCARMSHALCVLSPYM